MAVVEHQIGAVGDTVDRPFAAVLVEDGQFARAAGDHATAALILDHAQIAELGLAVRRRVQVRLRSEEHTSELQSLMRSSYAVLCLNKKTKCRLPVSVHNK